LPMPSLAPVTIAFFPVMPRSIAASPLHRHGCRPREPLLSTFALIATAPAAKPRHAPAA
jgi:hypothetical protein